MPWGAAIIGAATLGGAALSSRASGKAADAQTRSAELASEEQRRQFDAIQKLLEPYVTSGAQSLTAQQALLGLGGVDAQRAAVDQLANSAQFAEMQRQGENAILQNAAATGGLRGGNTQAALAQFRPAALNQLIQQQYQNLGGLTSLGQNAAALQGNAGMQTAANIGNNFLTAGNAAAQNAITQGAIQSQTLGQLAGLTGSFF